MQLLLCIISHKAEGGNDKIFFHTRKSCDIICYSASWPYLVKADKAMGLIDVRNHQAIPRVQALIESKVEKESVGDVTILHKHKPLTSEHAACSSTVSSLYVRLCSPVQTEDTSKTALRCDRRTSAHQKPWRWNRPFHLNITASHMSSTGADMMKSKNIKTRGRGAQKIFTLL